MLHLISVMIIVVTTLLISIRYFRGNDPMLSCSGYLHDFVLSWSSDLGGHAATSLRRRQSQMAIATILKTN